MKPQPVLNDAQRRSFAALYIAVMGTPVQHLANWLSVILADHPHLTADDLEKLSNLIGRHAHEKGRQE